MTFTNSSKQRFCRQIVLLHSLIACLLSPAANLWPNPLDVNRLILGMDDLVRRSLGEHIAIKTDLVDEAWPIFCDGNQLENALLNLALNARDAMRSGAN